MQTKKNVMILVALLATVALAGCAHEADDDAMTVTFGINAEFPPYEDLVDDRIVGFSPDIIDEINKRTDYTIRLQHMQFTAIIPSIQSGQIAGGISSFTITEDRRQLVDFSIPYYENELLVATRTGTTDITQPEHLEGRRVCTETGTTSETWLRENTGHTDDDLQLLDSFPLCADALRRGDVDAMMMDVAVVREMVEGAAGDIEEAFSIAVDEQFGIAVRRGDGDLLNAINSALQEMKSDGTLAELAIKWAVCGDPQSGDCIP